MAGLQKLALLLPLILLVASASGINLRVTVAGNADFSAYEFDYRETTPGLQRMNVSLENQGSIGCRFRLTGLFNRSGETDQVYSRPYAMWPGDARVAELYYMPVNFTGTMEGEVLVEFCGETRKLRDVSFEVERKHVTNTTLESRVLDVNSTHATVRTSVEDGVLIPVDVPPAWKASTATVENGETRLEYEPSLFQSKQIRYAVVRDGELVGETTVELTASAGLLEAVQSNIWKIMLLLSVFLNLILLGRGLAAEKLKL